MQRMPSGDLLATCALLELKQVNNFIFTYKGHDIDFSTCEKDRPIHVLKFICENLADQLTKRYIDGVRSLFGESE